MEFTKEEATKFFSMFYYGEHHFPGILKKWGGGWIMEAKNNMSTYDYNQLTRLVVLAHDMCIRAEILTRGMRIYIAVHKRQRDGLMMQKHPTLEQAIKEIRFSNSQL